ncbi:ribose 5-phosphate isomerase [Bosea sp. AAP35]|uniref:ribose-5-phosphate isomerase RpiA n=1 Tax=Bosea sp. AAP35 TaxID=1523417 RepID=UPI0006B934C6|nr:ribose-5-phosphate isomerase RpiA [Bosea sp. AAP35]KPF72584.1 ribose 5-phosphate isomerase [Bosea sp. AAP35]
MNSDELKKRAAARALELVTPGMRLGLGTGSTAKHFVDLLGARVAAGLDVICVSTSQVTEAQARALAIPMSTLDETPELDLTIDGADEVDSQLRLIKGGGAALLREKIVAAASSRMVVIADDSKLVTQLGQFPLPIEVVPFGLEATRRAVIAAITAVGAGGEIVLRRKPDGSVLVTDGGHYIFDAHLGTITRPEALSAALAAIPGVVEHGLFLGLATAAILAGGGGLTILGTLE